jgi:hypothetical protein
VPGVKYVAAGFCKADELPLPNSHLHSVGLPVERSWKLTTSGEQPAVGVAEKLAERPCPETVAVKGTSTANTITVFARILCK